MPPSSEVVATIAVDMEPGWIAVAPDGGRAYVTMTKSQGPDKPDLGAVAVIDTATDAVGASVPVGRSAGIVVTRDSRHVYVLHWHAGAVLSVIDAQTDAVVDDIELGRALPEGIAMTPDGRHVYAIVGNEADGDSNRGTVSVIDTATRKVVASLPGGPFPGRAAASPDGRFIYVLNTLDDPTLIDTTTHEKTLAPVGQGFDRIAFAPDGTLFGFSQSDFEMLGFNLATGKVVSALAADRRLRDLAVTPDGRLLCATLRAENPVVLFELGTFTPPAHRVSFSGQAEAIAVMPDGGSAYIVDGTTRTVRHITLELA